MMPARHALPFFFAAGLVACGSNAAPGGPPASSDNSTDTAHVTPSDEPVDGDEPAATKDAGVATKDAGVTTKDAGVANDAGAPNDAGTTSPLSCSGADLQASDIAPLLASGTAVFGGYRLEIKNRDCTGATCEAWQPQGEERGLVRAATEGQTPEHVLSFADPLARHQGKTAIGAAFDPAFLGELIGDTTGYTFAGTLKRTCAEVVASRSVAQGAQHTRETEVTLRAFFAPAPTGGTNAAQTTAQDVTFTCTKQIISYQYTCQGQQEQIQSFQQNAGAQVSADGSTLTLQKTQQLFPGVWNEDGDHPFDASGRHSHATGDETSYTSLRAVRASGGLVVDIRYHWFPKANSCGVAPRTNIECIGVLATP